MAMFPYLVTGNIEINLDNDSYYTHETKYQIEYKPASAGQFATGGDAGRRNGHSGPASGNNSRVIDNTGHQDFPEGNSSGAENTGQDPWDLIINQVLKAQKSTLVKMRIA
jgi:hypothetical protein